MKKILFIISLVLTSILTQAQLHSPAPDPVVHGAIGSRTALKDNTNWNVDENVSQNTRIDVLEAAPGGDSYWQENGTDLSPLTAGHDILLPSGDAIKWGTGTTQIAGNATDLAVVVGGFPNLTFTTGGIKLHDDIISDIPSSYNIGDLSSFILGGYFDKINFSATEYIEASGGKLYLTSNTATYDLDALGGGGTYLAGSGITLTGSTFHLDGTLTQNATITTTDDYEFKVQTTLAVLPRSAEISADIGRIELASYDNATFLTSGDWGKLTIDEEEIKLWSYKGADASSFTVSGGGFDMTSTTTTFIPPRMTTTQRTALTPAEGSIVFDTDLDGLFSYRGAAWGQIASGTPVVGGDILLLKSDWRSFTFGLGNANAADQALMIVGAKLGSRREGLGVSVPERVDAYVEGASGDVTIQIYHASDPTGAGTAILTTPLNITTAGGYVSTTAFDVASFAKDDVFWAEITAKGATEPTLIRVYYSYSFQ